MIANKQPSNLHIFCLICVFISFIILHSAVSCTQASSAASEENFELLSEESQEFMSWLNQRVDLMIRHKASCQQMAQALYDDHLATRAKRQKWKELKLGNTLAKRSIIDPQFGQLLTQQIMKGDLVYSYCAYQSSFRELVIKNSKQPIQ